MKILIDMNLSPDWVAAFTTHNIESVHWSSVGAANAADEHILEYAGINGFILFTHDLDFGALLAHSNAKSPSVIQVRAQDILPADLSDRLLAVLARFRPELLQGALIVVDETRERIRILPLRG